MAPVGIAVIGAGWWTTMVHLPSLAAQPGARLVAVCDPSPDRRAAAAADFAIPKQVADLAHLLDDPEVEAVVVATPHTTHAPIVEACLTAGRHVLVEKPMATTAADAWKLVEVAQVSGRILAVGSTYHYSPTALRVRDAVRGEIGELASITAEFSSNTAGLFQGVGGSETKAGVPHPATYSDPVTGGGQAYTQLTHLVNAVLWAAGDQAAEVSAFTANRGLAVDVVDALAFRMTSGALGVAGSTGTTPGGAPPRHRIRFHGTRGVVEWDMLAADAWIHREDGSAEHVVNPSDLPPYPREEVAARFVAIIEGRAANPAPADIAAASVALTEAALTAARTGRATEVVQGALPSVAADG